MSALPLRVLLVDDDLNIRKLLALSLAEMGCEVEPVDGVAAALKQIQAGGLDLVLTDLRLGHRSGLDLLAAAPSHGEAPLFVVMTAYASFDNAVEAVKAGAFDYLAKPFGNAQLEHLLAKVRTVVELRRENRYLRERRGRPDFFAGMLSPAVRRLEDFVRKVSPVDETVLLVGESGTGKTELARVIHTRSPRAQGPFVTVFCSTLAEGVLESELFGHARGAFTGAVSERAGKFETAQGGTLFLDEIGELSSSAQARLLRFLQDKVIERVGSNQPVPVDTRIIAATNRNLTEAVAEGRFREDLYYRLNILECSLVALRHRLEDIPVLARRFLEEASLGRGRARPLKLSPQAEALVAAYDWPGNLRELRNVCERLALLCDKEAAGPEDLPESLLASPRKASTLGSPLAPRSLEELERGHIEAVLLQEPNQERAAQILGITTVTLWRKRKQYGLP
ncbi:MAG TPA: sigma-54 dependent transcriptional regulator [bacterium]|jgi:DNA-binding NtrC family response regulator|nr:sigma-54 dependent transcriptional regulator [bacterium]